MKRKLQNAGNIPVKGSKNNEASAPRQSIGIGAPKERNRKKKAEKTASAVNSSSKADSTQKSLLPTTPSLATNGTGDKDSMDVLDADEMGGEFDKTTESEGSSRSNGVAPETGKMKVRSFKMCRESRSFEIDGIKFTIDELRPFFTRPFTEVAKVLGLSVGRMSRACRTCQLHRWPYRKLWGISHNIKSLERIIEETTEEADKEVFRNQINTLAKRHQEIMDFPERIYTPPETEASTKFESQEASSSSQFPLPQPQNMRSASSFRSSVGQTIVPPSRMMGSVQLLERIEAVVEEVKAIEVEHAHLQKRIDISTEGYTKNFDSKLRSLIEVILRRLEARIKSIEVNYDEKGTGNNADFMLQNRQGSVGLPAPAGLHNNYVGSDIARLPNNLEVSPLEDRTSATTRELSGAPNQTQAEQFNQAMFERLQNQVRNNDMVSGMLRNSISIAPSQVGNMNFNRDNMLQREHMAQIAMMHNNNMTHEFLGGLGQTNSANTFSQQSNDSANALEQNDSQVNTQRILNGMLVPPQNQPLRRDANNVQIPGDIYSLQNLQQLFGLSIQQSQPPKK